MLTIEMLRQNPALTGLTDAHLGAITEMSRNDETTVVNSKIADLNKKYEAGVMSITSLAKQSNEQSVDYIKRVLGEFKTKAESSDSVKNELEEAKKTVLNLQEKIKSNSGDETLLKNLNDAKTQVTQLQNQLQLKENEFNNEKVKLESSINDIRIDHAFQTATASLKFKNGISEKVQKIVLNSAKAEVLSKGTPDFVDDGNGGKKLVIRGEDGNILNNPKNNLNPYSLQELIHETSLKDVIDTGRNATGGGTGSNGTTGGNNGSIIDLSGLKTQVEATDAIERSILAEGLTRDSNEFFEKFEAAYAENNVSELPIR